MSVYQHRRNFSLITTQPHPSNKIKATNRSLRKIQNQINNQINPVQPNIKNQVQNFEWLLVAAKQYYHKTNNHQAAISNFEQYLLHYPNHQESLYLCAVCYMHLEQYGRAIQKLKDYLATKKNNQNSLGLSLNRKLIINSSMQLPNLSHAYLLLSMAYNKVNNIAKAIDAVNQALRNDNKFEQGYCFRAKLYLKLNQNQKAFYDYKQVLKINNKCWTAWVGLGDYYTQIMNYQQGLKCYQKAKQYLELQKISEKSTMHHNNFNDEEFQKQDNIVKKQHQFVRESGFDQEKNQSKDRYDQKRISKINDKLREYVERPTESFEFNQQKQPKMNQEREKQKVKSQLMVNNINKPKLKVALKAITSPYSQTNHSIKSPNTKILEAQSPKIIVSQAQNISQHNTEPIQIHSQSQISKQLELKISICLYYLGNYARSIFILKALLATNKATNYNSQIYYYLAINQLKIFDQNKDNKNSIKINMPVQQQFISRQLNPMNKSKTANVGVITTSSTSSHNPKNTLTNQLINSIKSPTNKTELELTPFELLHQSILNLESSITSNNNKKIMAKSCKTLIKLYIENNQFYETQSVLKLADKYELDKQQNAYGISQYKLLCQACMLVIRQKYQQAGPILKKLFDNILTNNENESKIKRSMHQTSKNNQYQNNNIRLDETQMNISKGTKLAEKQKCSSLRLSKTKQKKNQGVNQNKLTGQSLLEQFQRYEQYEEYQNKKGLQIQADKQRQILINSAGHGQKKLYLDIKMINKNTVKGSYTLDRQKDKKMYEENSTEYNQFKNISIRNKIYTSTSPQQQQQFSTHYQQNQQSQNENMHKLLTQPPVSASVTTNQCNWMIPIVLLFRAYAEYFSDNFIECLEIYEHYQNHIKDYLGKQPDTDIYLSYNKILCEGILMLDNQMIEESIDKFMLAVDNYYRLMKNLAVQPILFRVLALIRLAVSQSPILSEELNNRNKIFRSILQTLDHYMPAIKNNPLVHYYYALVQYELEKFKQASDSLQKCLKMAEECTWKFLYVKGVVEIKNKLYKQAIREFSAGLLVEQKSEIYLGRCICYIQLFDQSQGQTQAYMQKSFQDLQKFIELEQDKDKISKWVTKILFFNKAYEQVTKSIKKVSAVMLQSEEDMLKIDKCLNIYNGVFEDGGVLGQMLINAFQGKFQQSSIEINGERHEVILSDFVEKKYKKWLNLLNLYSAQRYSQLIKFLQLTIFEEKNQQEAIQLRYNLAIVYYLSNQSSKADNVLAGLPKYLPDITSRVEKFINRELLQDQCIDDLQKQLKGVRRLSSYLPYRKIMLRNKGISIQSEKSIFVKISLPFPNFFKPDIDLHLDDLFLYGETAQSCIPKKIQAPWIKKVTGHIQFTDNIIQSQDTSIFDHDILEPGSESKISKYEQQQSFSLNSSIKRQ